MRSLEQGRLGLGGDSGDAAWSTLPIDELTALAAIPTPDRLFQVEGLLRRGVSIEEVHDATGIDPWFLDQMSLISEANLELAAGGIAVMDRASWRWAKRLGFGDAQLAHLWSIPELEVREARVAAGVLPTYKTVDTCAAEFAAATPYYYSTWEDEDEVPPSTRPKVIILGSGPNRIGQGIEFDYCCVHACFALREAGYDVVMVNCNPETVSTDYDTSDRLYFEPLTYEDVLNVIEAEQRSGILAGVIVSLGGQTPLKLADLLAPELILGTSPASIDAAEDRQIWNALCARLEIPQPAGGTARTLQDARVITARIGFPALIRPSYVLGGRAMQIVYDDGGLVAAMAELANAGSLGREGGLSAERPVLIDRFLEDATEVDVDAIRDGTGQFLLGGIMEHVEEAGVHSGDSACVLPPMNLSRETLDVLEVYTRSIAEELAVVGPLNVQYAVKAGQVFVLEANPRASRTVPFVAKATGVALAKVASRVMAGASLAQLRGEGVLVEPVVTSHVAVKEAVLPFSRFPDSDALLGPEMRSTGEVMGIDMTFGMAFAKSQLAAGTRLPKSGTVFLSLSDRDKRPGILAAKLFAALGLRIVATEGTARAIEAAGVAVDEIVARLDEGRGSDAVALISSGRIDLVINSPRGRGARADGAHIRAAAGRHGVPLLTTGAAGLAAANGMTDWAQQRHAVRTLQEFHRGDTSGGESQLTFPL